ncbi:hypothetical protein BJV43_004804 [Clostridium saccharoperbutylacetonicum]|nr:hypothetical protein [Clostridium saccharoperbutylacetonicum]
MSLIGLTKGTDLEKKLMKCGKVKQWLQLLIMLLL